MSEKNKSFSTEAVMTAYLAIVVIPITALIIFTLVCFSVVAASPKYQHQTDELVFPEQKASQNTEDDTDELLMWELFLNESISNDW